MSSANDDTRHFMCKLLFTTHKALCVNIVDYEESKVVVLVENVFVPKSILRKVDADQIRALINSEAACADSVGNIEIPLWWCKQQDWFESEDDD